ncbi:MAG TPA: hypothetical protein VN817_07935 [Solirubrobacteraceae bacterium]|nr:hypothetical protein [Solirubrobacteraceae bacterium]
MLAGALGCAGFSPAPALATGPLTSSVPLLSDISCSSTTLCAAVDNKGHAVISTDPTDASPTWSDSETNLVVPTAISCAATALCAAVDVNGSVSVTADPTAPTPSWTAMSISAAHSWIEDISCPTTSLCVAVDRQGHALTSTDPTAATPTWNAALIDSRAVPFSEYPSAVSCASSSLCVAVDTLGDAVVSTDPGAATPKWSAPVQIDSVVPSGISCPTTSLCVVVDSSGRAVRSSDPAATVPTWSAPEPISTRHLRGVSCPATTLCAAAGELFNVSEGAGVGVASSTDPDATTPAWQSTPPFAAFGSLESPTSISCASTFCVIAAGGQATTSTDPADASPTWSSPRTIDTVPAGELSVLGTPGTKGTSAALELACTPNDLVHTFQIEGDGALQECSGSATLSTSEQLSANGRVVTGVAPSTRAKRSRTVTIGQTTLSGMYAGDLVITRTADVALNPTGRHLLAKFKRLPATLSVSAAASELRVPPKIATIDTSPVTFKAKAAPRRTRCHRSARAKRCRRARHRR